jgi:hypothetical protein
MLETQQINGNFYRSKAGWKSAVCRQCWRHSGDLSRLHPLMIPAHLVGHGWRMLNGWTCPKCTRDNGGQHDIQTG